MVLRKSPNCGMGSNFYIVVTPTFCCRPAHFRRRIKLVCERDGAVYERGRALNNDSRRNIIQDIVENGGDFVTGFFPGNLSVIALKNRTKYDTVKKIWKQFCESGTTKFQSQTGGSKHLQPDDIELIRFLKTSRASMPKGELYKHVNDFCNVPGGTSLAAIHRALQKDMNDGK